MWEHRRQHVENQQPSVAGWNPCMITVDGRKMSKVLICERGIVFSCLFGIRHWHHWQLKSTEPKKSTFCPRLHVLHHEVVEAIHMTRSLEDGMLHNTAILSGTTALLDLLALRCFSMFFHVLACLGVSHAKADWSRAQSLRLARRLSKGVLRQKKSALIIFFCL